MADAIFPCFLFAMGSAMGLGAGARLDARRHTAKLVRRAAMFFLLGFLMYWFPFIDRTAEGWEVRALGSPRSQKGCQDWFRHRPAAFHIRAGFGERPDFRRGHAGSTDKWIRK